MIDHSYTSANVLKCFILFTSMIKNRHATYIYVDIDIVRQLEGVKFSQFTISNIGRMIRLDDDDYDDFEYIWGVKSVTHVSYSALILLHFD